MKYEPWRSIVYWGLAVQSAEQGKLIGTRQGRSALEHRHLVVRRGVNVHAEGSALLELGRTQVLVTVTLEDRVPQHVRDRRDGAGKRLPPSGWLMAEYNLLPRATHERTLRERARLGGRTAEIQRLLGRALRPVLELELFAYKTIVVDADVLQADGSTRVASILGGFAALYDMADRFTRLGQLDDWPIKNEVGAVSVGIIDGELCLDLDYNEDVRASADLNVIATANGEVIEVQGGAEEGTIAQASFLEMLNAGLGGVSNVLTVLKGQL